MRPTIKDLTVMRDSAEMLEISSHLTRGRCATVYMFGVIPGHRQIAPFLIPSYMQGITLELIGEAVDAFLAAEASQRS